MKKTDNRKASVTKTRKLIVSALLSALSVVLIYLGSFTPLDLTLICISAMAVVFAVIEMGSFYPYLIYAVTSVISLLILPDKSTALIYVLIVGYYPIAKAAFERYHYVVCWILKLSLFNTALILTIVITKYVLGMNEDGLVLTAVTILLGNAVFILCDVLFSKLIVLYIVKLRPRLGLKNIF